jgi:hypothetical protein
VYRLFIIILLVIVFGHVLGPGLSTDLGERRLRRIGSGLLVVLWAVWIVGSPVAAQGRPDTGGRVFGAIGGVGGNGESARLASVGAGIRVTKRLGVDFELLHARDLGCRPISTSSSRPWGPRSRR